jgi:threonine/homoserine/homoserine lactone efflux protein
MLTFLTAGIVLGLSAGFAPGPLLALVVSETLQHDRKAGVKVALAPVITDLPIIIFSLLVLAKLSRFQNILGIISVIGAFFILYLGITNMKIKGVQIDADSPPQKSLQKGILVNALSPHPYLFWLTVGGPTTIKALDFSLLAAIGFVVCFYVLLVGSKILLAMLVSRSRSFLQQNTYILTMRLLGLILILLAGYLFQDGLQLLLIL